MVFTNPIMTIHVKKITDRPQMSLIVARRCNNANLVYLRGGYQEPIVITIPNLDQRNGHYVRPNRVAFKYFDFKKDVDPNAHVTMFNFIIKTNVETSKECIINVVNYALRDTTSD
jgi:hypothetical protein